MAEDIQVVAHLRAIDDGFTKAFQQASQSANQLNQTVGGVNKGLIAAGAVLGGGAFALVKWGKASFQAAARVSELNVAIDAIGKSTGIGAKNIKSAANAIRDNGIEMAAAQQMAIEFAQGNLDMAEASKVARVAQDLAVISQKNSTDTAMILTRAIKTGNSMLLKSAGVSAQASEGYARYALSIGKTANTLNAQERQQAIINLIMEEGTKVAGVYTAAMQEPGKVLRSFPRIVNDMQVAMGNALLAGFGPMIKASYDLFSNVSKLIREGGALYPVVSQLTIAMQMLFAPFTAGLEKLVKLVKGFKDAKLDVDGLGESISKFTPMLMAAATAITTMAGKSLLLMTPLKGLAGGLNPVVAGIGVLVALNPKLRDSFGRVAKAAAPLIPAFLKFSKAIGQAAQAVLEGIASIVEVLAGPLAGIITVVSGAFYAFASVLEMMGPLLEPLIILIGIKFVAALVMQKVAAAQSAIATGTATTAQMLFGKATMFASGMVEYFATASRFGATGMQAFTAMTVQGFMAMKAAVISFMSSMLPMLLMAVALYAVFKIFTAFSDRNKQVEERTKALTEAIETQVGSLKKNKVALGEYLSSFDQLGKTIATTGEDGEKLTHALNYLNKEQTDALPTLLAFKKNTEQAAYAMAIAEGASHTEALAISRAVDTHENIAAVLAKVSPEFHELARQLEEVDDQAEKTNIKDFVQGHLDAVTALGKEEAQIIKTTQATIEAEFAAKNKAGTDEMYLAILDAVGKELAKTSEAEKKIAKETEKAEMAVSTMIDRLKEFKPAAEDGKAAAEEMAKAMFGIENYDAVAHAKTFFELREAMTGIQDAAKGARGDFDALTKTGFDLFEQINKNSAALYNMGKSEEYIAAASSAMIEGFIKSAKAGKATDEQINKILESMNLLSGLRTRVMIDADITGVKEKIAAVVKALELMNPAKSRDDTQARYLAQLNATLAVLEKESKAYDAVAGSLTRVSDASKKAGEADKALQKQKDKLIEQITKKYNVAIAEASKKLEELKAKLDALRSATDDAIVGSFDFGNALSAAQQKADEYNGKIEEAKQIHDDYAKSVEGAVSSILSMSDALSRQQSAAQDLVVANENLAKAQQMADIANEKFNVAIDKYANAAGRKARREAFEEIQKAALDLVPAQEALADATDKASAAQAKQISFVDQLRAQYEQAKGFAGKIQQLLTMGLSKEGMSQIIQAGAVTGGLMADELIAGGSAAVAETNKLFVDIADVSEKAGLKVADQYFTIGNTVGADFIAALAAQANKATVFADKVKQLVAAGFSPGAIQQVLNAGVEAGTQIAQALLDGGSEAVATSTKIENALLATAESLKTLLGSTFYDAGIALAQQLVDGLEAKLAELQDLMGDMSLGQLQQLANKPVQTKGVVSTGGGVGVAETMAVKKGLLTQEQADALIARRYSPSYAYATGGIAQTPQIAMIAEKGPEAVLPLNMLAQMSNGGGQPINITVNAGMGADGASIGDAIVNELIRYQRRNGKIPVKTQ